MSIKKFAPLVVLVGGVASLSMTMGNVCTEDCDKRKVATLPAFMKTSAPKNGIYVLPNGFAAASNITSVSVTEKQITNSTKKNQYLKEENLNTNNSLSLAVLLFMGLTMSLISRVARSRPTKCLRFA